MTGLYEISYDRPHRNGTSRETIYIDGDIELVLRLVLALSDLPHLSHIEVRDRTSV